MSTPNSIGLSGVAAVLPPQRHSLAELADRRRLRSDAAVLADLGYTAAHLADPDHDAAWLARSAAAAALSDAGLAAESIDAVIWAGALPDSHVRPVPGDPLLARFAYSASWLQHELGLHRASVHGVAQQGCGGMFSALRMAHALLAAEPDLQHVLCVGVDVLPADAPREILYTLISDAAAGVVVSRRSPRDRWLGFHQVSKGYYWDVPARQNEIIASYFPTSRLVITELLARHGLTPADIDCIVPTGIGAGSWDVLTQLCGLDPARLHRGRAFGHTIAADSFLHLADLRAAGALRPGARVLLFTYGFGSSWCGLLLDH
ncbi:MAG TPA: 3-oxoacyl-[acyl-carrier-protein] synthase III C-terminal domain-containing protein [Opitutaceae bacterium]|nr:3-oxoacyl-[acyl-carrier-protein] synthase III C-terminal domain-containing protein [Opitutaceae bacterium]